MKYYYLDLNRKTCAKLYDIALNDNTINNFVKIKINDLQLKFNEDEKILMVGLPLKNKSTKDILTILEENNLDFEITEHHN